MTKTGNRYVRIRQELNTPCAGFQNNWDNNKENKDDYWLFEWNKCTQCIILYICLLGNHHLKCYRKILKADLRCKDGKRLGTLCSFSVQILEEDLSVDDLFSFIVTQLMNTFCLRQWDRPSRVFSLSAPTGGSKKLASLAVVTNGYSLPQPRST